MSQREGVIFFNHIKFWVQKLGTIRQLIYSVKLPHRLPLEKNLSQPLRRRCQKKKKKKKKKEKGEKKKKNPSQTTFTGKLIFG